MARILFSFDDARRDSFDAIKTAEKYGIYSTLNVTTGYVERSVDASLWPSKVEPMSIEELLLLHKEDLVEIACHSHSHINDFDDIVFGKRELCKILNENDDSLGFASPSSKIDFTANPIEKFLNNGFSYVRVGHKKDKYERVKRVIRKISRLTGEKRLFFKTYESTLRNCCCNNVLYGIPVLRDNSFSQLKYFVDQAIKKNYTVIFIFHSVLPATHPFYNDTWTWPINNYVRLCEYIGKRIADSDLTSCKSKDLINE